MTRLPTPLRPLFPIAKRGIVFSTQLVGPVTRRLPGTDAHPTPPRHMTASTADYVSAHPSSGVTFTPSWPTIRLARSLPEGLPADHFAFAHHLHATVPDTLVAQLPQGRAVGPFGAVITADDTLLFDLSPYFGAFVPSQHPIFLRLRLPPVQDVSGSVAVLTTRGVDNYYHFLTDVLPRLELLKKAGLEPDRYLVNRATAFQRELLNRVGITEAQTLESSSAPHIHAEELIVPSLPDSHLRTPPWVVTWLRDQLLPDDPAPPQRRLYLSRGQRKNTRRVENEEEVLAALAPHGFEAIDAGSLTVAEQVRHFAEAEIVVGAHGAAMTNIAFCPPGTAVVELFPEDYVNVCYWALASALGNLRYRYLVGDGQPHRVRPMHGVASDIRIDCRQLVRIIDEIT